MAPSLDINAVLDDLARRVAVAVSDELGRAGSLRMQRLLTVEQAAKYLGRSKGSVQHMVASGVVPTVRSDRRVFLDVVDLDAWIERHKE